MIQSKIKILFILHILFPALLITAQSASQSASLPSPSSSTNSTTAQPISVHEMFKDVSQDELLAMMEEGQQFIKYLEEHGTPEEKMAFAQAMEDTLQSFTEDDWAEFEAIVNVVQDKLPPLEVQEEKPIVKDEKKEEKEISKVSSIDTSLDKVLTTIHKNIQAILLKSKSDKILSERMNIDWANKDQFHEMTRLLQLLHKKDHLIRLNSTKDNDDIKSLVESIQNFNKRLQIENDQFTIADTFGLQVDEKTTKANLKKLNTILDFLDSAIASLLPKLTKFIQEYEPEALKKSQLADDENKKALEHATKIEKMPKQRYSNASYGQEQGQYQGQRYPTSQPNYNNYNPNSSQNTNRPEEYLDQVHKEHLRNIPMPKKSSSQQSEKKDEQQKDKSKLKKSSYDQAIDYLESNLDDKNLETSNYNKTMYETQKIYQPFENKNTKNPAIKINDEEQLRLAHANFTKNTQTAHSYYDDLRESIENIAEYIEEIQQVIGTIRKLIPEMDSKELEKLNSSNAFKNFENRLNNYYNAFKNAQRQLKDKHKLYRLERDNAYEIDAYNQLEAKINTMHGFDHKISEAKIQLESLRKAIKSAISRHRRDENKAAALEEKESSSNKSKA